MKTNVLMKIAVVAMAAFGAYAFSGNTAQQTPFMEAYYLDSEIGCTNIEARCADDGNENCTIFVGSSIMPVLDLICEKNMKHTSQQPVEWRN